MAEYKCSECGSDNVAVDASCDYLVNPNTGEMVSDGGGDIIWEANSAYIQCRECDASADSGAEWEVK